MANLRKIVLLLLVALLALAAISGASAQNKNKKQQQQRPKPANPNRRPKPQLAQRPVNQRPNKKQPNKPSSKVFTTTLPDLGKIRGRTLLTEWTGQKVMQFLDIPYGKAERFKVRFRFDSQFYIWNSYLWNLGQYLFLF